MTTPDAATQPSNKKKLALAGTAIVLIALLAAGLRWWSLNRFVESTDDAYLRADIVTVSARMAGAVASVNVADNQAVHQGDVLVQIERDDYAQKVALAQAGVDTAVATLRGQQAEVATLGAQIARQVSLEAAALADVAVAEAGVARRSTDAERYRQLAADHASSGQRSEQARADALTADALLVKARASARAEHGQRAVLLKRRDQAVAAIAQAQARLGAAKAALILARIDLGRTTIRAASDGVVGQRTVRRGEYVETGQPLLAIVPLQALYVIANFKETEVAAMCAGQPADVAVDTYAGHTLHGHVLSIAPGSGAQFALLPPDNATGNFTKVVQRVPVKIAIDAGQQTALSLRPGLSVVVRVQTGGGALP